MVNKKVVELAKYARDFKADKSEFDLLSQMSSDELGMINDRVAKVTPLLRQISSYAMIVSFIDDCDIETLRQMTGNNKLFDRVDDIRTACADYLYDLGDDDCHNPTFKIYKALNVTALLFDEINDSLWNFFRQNDSITETDKKVNDTFIDICNDVDHFYETSLGFVAENINLFNTPNKLLTALSMISLALGLKFSLVSQQNILEAFDKNAVVDSNYQDLSLLFSNMFMNINGNSSIDQETKDYLNEAYYLYKSYQYVSLTNGEKEKTLLKKCKKM